MAATLHTPSTPLPPSAEELAFADAILEHAGSTNGLLTSDAAVEIFNRSGLSRYDLRDIWGLADADSNGTLAKEELLVALRVMGWVQSGEKFSRSLCERPGPLAKIDGISLPRKVEEVKQNGESSQQAHMYHQPIPELRRGEPELLHEEFLRAGPVNGRLDGDIAREIYLKSDLSYKELSGIWNLVDRSQTGHLTFSEFALGLHLINSLKSCRLTTVPQSLPDHLFEYLESLRFDSPPPPSKTPIPTPPVDLSPPPLPGKPPRSPPVENGAVPSSSSSPLPRRPSSAFPLKSPKVPPKPPPPLRPKPGSKPWGVTKAQKAEYDADFVALDAEGTGMVPEEVALRFLRKFHLPVDELAHIWDLAAIRNDRYLNSDEFAVAMYLVQERLAGKDIPYELPKFLVPPSLRSISVSSPTLASPTLASPAPTDDPPFPIPTLNGMPVSDLPRPLSMHRPSHSTPSSSYFSESPTAEVGPGPPISSNLSRSTTSTVSLKFLTENPSSSRSRDTTNRRRSIAKHSKSPSFVSTSTPTPPYPTPPEQLQGVSENETDEDPLLELRTETKTLRKQVDTLLQQLSSQNEYRISNEALRKENADLKTKLAEVETSMAAVLAQMQRNDNALSDELTQEIGRLTRRLGELEQTESQLQHTVGILEACKRDNALLASQVRELRAAEATHRVELEAARNLAEELEQENADVKARLGDMTKAMAEPGDARSSRELRVLLQDVTRENQALKEKTREMERSMEALLLSSRDTGQVERMKRENRELRMQIHDLEQVTAQLQTSHEDSHLQQVLMVLTRENEGMKVRIRDMQAGAAQMRGESDARMQEMQRRIDQLAAENAQLKTQIQQRGSMGRHEEEDMSVPPPAYDDNFIPPDTR